MNSNDLYQNSRRAVGISGGRALCPTARKVGYKMEMKRLTEHIYYYPHQPETDRPMLAYVKGEKIALVIDAGASAHHVDEFYAALDVAGLRKPNLTAITHWHWDHTFGMHRIHGLSIAGAKTSELLCREKERLSESGYEAFLKRDDECLAKEYAGGQSIVATPSAIQFEDRLVLNLGGMTAQLFETAAPHSEDTTLIYIPEEKALFLGDATSEDFYNNGYMDKSKLKSLIHIIEEIDCNYCVLSHTEPLSKTELLGNLDSVL